SLSWHFRCSAISRKSTEPNQSQEPVMRFQIPTAGIWSTCVFFLLAAAPAARAATIAVPAGGDLQAALNAAKPGDVITLQPGATYSGNFVLPNKGAISDYITLRSAAADNQLPRP